MNVLTHFQTLAQYNRIRLGMTPEEVEAVLGPAHASAATARAFFGLDDWQGDATEGEPPGVQAG